MTGEQSAVPGGGPDQADLPADSTLTEHAYLVARGVRALALAGHCRADPMVMLRASTRLSTAAAGCDVLPFVIDFGEGSASCGYAAAKWAIDLYESVMRDGHPHRHAILGLLLGYSPAAISRHEENSTGRRFTGPLTSPDGCRNNPGIFDGPSATSPLPRNPGGVPG